MNIPLRPSIHPFSLLHSFSSSTPHTNNPTSLAPLPSLWRHPNYECLPLGSVNLFGPFRALSCPGSSVQYSCQVSPAVNSIPWNVTCPDQPHPFTPSVRVNDDQTTVLYHCRGNDGDIMVIFEITAIAIRSNINDVTQSNKTVTILSTNYSINSLKSLRIGCEGAAHYSYLEITGTYLRI